MKVVIKIKIDAEIVVDDDIVEYYRKRLPLIVKAMGL